MATYPDLPLILARVALAQTDDNACTRGWDDLVAKYGWEEANRAWRQASAEFDASPHPTTPPALVCPACGDTRLHFNPRAFGRWDEGDLFTCIGCEFHGESKDLETREEA